MEVSEAPFVFLGIKVKPGPIERVKLENYAFHNTVNNLKTEVEKRANVPSDSLEIIHRGKVLQDQSTLQDCGVKNGEMIHVVQKAVANPSQKPARLTDAELQHLNNSMRTIGGCSPNSHGWTRAMQLLNDESVISEILDAVPSLAEECTTISVLHEAELLAAIAANAQTMRRAADAYPDLPHAITRLLRIVCNRCHAPTENTPTSGFAYSLEALSEEEDAEEEDAEDGERNAITQEQLAAALQVATEAVMSRTGGGQEGLFRLLQAAGRNEQSNTTGTSNEAGSSRRAMITPEMFSEAISEAMTRASAPPTPMEQSTAASSSQSPVAREEDFSTQLTRMHEMGLLDDIVNVRALLICAGDVNAAINLVFSGAIGDD